MHVGIRSVLPVLALAVVSGCGSIQVQSSQVRSAQGWLTEGESAQRTNAVHTRITPPLELKWDLNIGAGFGVISPIIVDELIFIANRKGEIHAVEFATGRRMGQSAFGESIEGTPVYENGNLYIPVGWGRSSLIAYDLLGGKTRWKVKGTSISSGLLTYADVVIAADDDGVVRAHRKTDGEIDWMVSLGEGVGVKASPILAAGHVIVIDDRGRVSALNAANGSSEWSVDLGAPVLSTPTADEEAIYVATSRGRFVKISADDGSEEWSYNTTDGNVYFASPALDGEQVVFGASDGVVRAIETSSGQELWSHAVDAAVTAPPLLTEEFAYIGTMNSKLLAIDRRTGFRAWTYDVDGRIKSAFASKGNAVVVLSEPRTVYLFEPSADDYARSND